MHMIGHQDIGMDMALEFVTGCLEVFLVTRIVLLSKETRLAIIPSLNDVLGNPQA